MTKAQNGMRIPDQRFDYFAVQFGLLPSEIAALFRAERALHRWAEQECGDGNAFASWCIVRDDDDGKTYREVHPHQGASYRVRIQDRESAALRRVKTICEARGLHFYHQGDPRGCALYISREPLASNDYTRGIAVCA